MKKANKQESNLSFASLIKGTPPLAIYFTTALFRLNNFTAKFYATNDKRQIVDFTSKEAKAFSLVGALLRADYDLGTSYYLEATKMLSKRMSLLEASASHTTSARLLRAAIKESGFDFGRIGRNRKGKGGNHAMCLRTTSNIAAKHSYASQKEQEEGVLS